MAIFIIRNVHLKTKAQLYLHRDAMRSLFTIESKREGRSFSAFIRTLGLSATNVIVAREKLPPRVRETTRR